MSNLEIATCYAIIIAMGVVVIKAFHNPMSRILLSLNPFYYFRRMRSMEDRLNEHEMEIYDLKNELAQLKKKNEE